MMCFLKAVIQVLEDVHKTSGLEDLEDFTRFDSKTSANGFDTAPKKPFWLTKSIFLLVAFPRLHDIHIYICIYKDIHNYMHIQIYIYTHVYIHDVYTLVLVMLDHLFNLP